MIDLNIPANIKSLQNLQIDGFVPVIFQIVPTTNLQFLIGESESAEDQQLTLSLN